MKHLKPVLVSAIIVIAVMAVVYRVEFLRKIVLGA